MGGVASPVPLIKVLMLSQETKSSRATIPPLDPCFDLLFKGAVEERGEGGGGQGGEGGKGGNPSKPKARTEGRATVLNRQLIEFHYSLPHLVRL